LVGEEVVPAVDELGDANSIIKTGILASGHRFD
jgi:hypothetical protein